MNIDNFIDLIVNALLLSFLLIPSHLLRIHYLNRYAIFDIKKVSGKILIGFWMGIVGVAVMCNPLYLDNGLIFDSRFVLIALVSFFFDIPITLICISTIVLWRFHLDGVLLTTTANFLLGLAIMAVRFFWNPYYKNLSHIYFSDLFFYGFVTQSVNLLGLMLFIPIPSLVHLMLPTLLLYPFLTVLLAYILNHNGARPIRVQRKIEDNFLFHIKHNPKTQGLSLTSPQKELLSVNRNLCKLLGYSEEELQNLTWIDYTHPDDREGSLLLFNELLKGNIEHYEEKKRIITKQGETVPIQVNVFAIRDDDNDIEVLVTTYIDLSNR